LADKCSVAISGSVKKKLDEYSFKTGVKCQHIVDKAVLEEISKHVSEDEIEVAKLLREAKADVYGLNEVKQVMSSVNFYDGYSDNNLKSVLEKMPNADEEYVALLTRVYALGKNKTIGVKEKLKKAVEILERCSPEAEPKQLGHTLEEWRVLRRKKEAEITEGESDEKNIGNEV
jgi:hypothetical protein